MLELWKSWFLAFFLGNFCGDKMLFPLLFHALFLTGSFLYINSDISVLSSDPDSRAVSFVITRIIKLVQSSTYIRYFFPGILFTFFLFDDWCLSPFLSFVLKVLFWLFLYNYLVTSCLVYCTIFLSIASCICFRIFLLFRIFLCLSVPFLSKFNLR